MRGTGRGPATAPEPAGAREEDAARGAGPGGDRGGAHPPAPTLHGPLPPAAAAPALKARALRWLAQREHSRAELRGKLLRHLAAAARAADAEATALDAAAAVDAVLDELVARGHLSDERFAASRLHLRAPRFGERRIAAELARHGLEVDAAAGQALRASEADRAAALWARKYGRPAADARERARQMRFLAGRGFAAEVIRRVVPPAAVAPDDDAGG